MARRPTPRPTDAELAILRVLWRHGRCTVREVHEELQKHARHGYTSVLKIMQIMAETGLVARDERARAHVYEPVQSEADTQRGLVRDLAERAFGGSANDLILRALSDRRASKKEIDEIQRLLDRLPEGDS